MLSNVNTTLMGLFFLILLGACTQQNTGLMSGIQERHRNNSFVFNQVDESMIRAVGNLDSTASLKDLDQYVEEITVFEIDHEDRIFDSAWVRDYLSNIDYTQFEELARMSDDSSQVRVLMVQGLEGTQVFDVVLQTPNSLLVVEIVGDNPMGITTALAQGITNGEDPMSTLSKFGL